MPPTQNNDPYLKLELLTRRRIFYLLLIIIPVILPPISTKGFSYLLDLPSFSIYVANALFDYKSIYAKWMPALHGVMLLFFLLVLIFRHRVSRVYSGFVALNFILTVITQTMVKTNLFGTIILTEISLWYMVVVVLWAWEAIIKKNRYSFSNTKRNLWLIPLMLFAFWNPDHPWNFSPKFFIYGFSPVAFCMLTPIYLSVLLFSFPRVNLPLVRIHSFIGLIIGFVSLFISIIQKPVDGFYWAMLHTPLIVISFYAFRISFRYQVNGDHSL